MAAHRCHDAGGCSERQCDKDGDGGQVAAHRCICKCRSLAIPLRTNAIKASFTLFHLVSVLCEMASSEFPILATSLRVFIWVFAVAAGGPSIAIHILNPRSAQVLSASSDQISSL